MPNPRPYTDLVVIATIPLIILSVASVDPDHALLLTLFTLAYAVLCLRTYQLPSGVLMTAAAPLAITAMAIFYPMELFAFSVLGMIVVKVQARRPWANTLINIFGVGGGLVVGAWIYRTSLEWFGLVDAPLVYRILPFAAALQVRDLFNHLVVAPVIAHRQGRSTIRVLWETTLQSGWGQFALNGTGLGFAELVHREGAGVLIYLLLVLFGIHMAVEFYVRRAEVQRAAEQDGLTLVKNRMAFERMAGSSAWRGLLVVLDCDGLKQLNDTQGHLAGDEMLKELAQGLVRVAGSEHVYRYGGDEFVLLLPDRTTIGPMQRVLRDLEARYGSSASMGVCSIPGEAAGVREAFALADERMYAAKLKKSSA